MSVDPLEIIVRRDGWRLDALDRWRDRTEARIGKIELEVSEMQKADAIAAAVAERIDGRRRFEWTLLRLVGAGLVTVLVVGSAVGSFLLQLFHGSH